MKMNKIPCQIRAQRRALGYTMQEVAAHVGSYKQYISKIERGEQNPSLDLLLKILNFLNLKIQLMPSQRIYFVSFSETKAVFEIELNDSISDNELMPVVSNYQRIETAPTAAEWAARKYSATAARALVKEGLNPAAYERSGFPADGLFEFVSETNIPVSIFTTVEDVADKFLELGMKNFKLKQ